MYIEEGENWKNIQLDNDDIHVLPINDLMIHLEERFCPCNPNIEQACPVCDGYGCFNCDNDGFICSNDLNRDAVVVHNAYDGRE